MNYKELLGENYKEGMTAEDILKALEEVSIEDNSSEIEKYKSLLSKANSEASNYKKELKAKLTEEEQKEAERIAEFEQLKEELNMLKRDKAMSENTAQFLALGYDDKLARDTATALVEGDLTKVFANHKVFTQTLEKKIKADLMTGTPKPEGQGDVEKKMTKEQFLKLGLDERAKFAQDNPQEYNAIYGE